MNSEDLDEVQVKKMMTEEQIELTLTITSNDCNMNTWRGFVSEGSLFLKGDGWDDLSIRESVVAALDLAEEQLECHTVFLCLEKNNSNLDALVRTLMYAGFEIVLPGVLPNADPKYLALGMEL
ncbi:Ornithine decarboxylase antizyme 2 [Podila humilis]|nr:Ornithine decarboxylase antizyme 2 [Podila humilis]